MLEIVITAILAPIAFISLFLGFCFVVGAFKGIAKAIKNEKKAKEI